MCCNDVYMLLFSGPVRSTHIFRSELYRPEARGDNSHHVFRESCFKQKTYSLWMLFKKSMTKVRGEWPAWFRPVDGKVLTNNSIWHFWLHNLSNLKADELKLQVSFNFYQLTKRQKDSQSIPNHVTEAWKNLLSQTVSPETAVMLVRIWYRQFYSDDL